MAVTNETDAEREARMDAWAATGAPARPDDTSVLAGRRMSRDDMHAFIAQLEVDRSAGITDRDWSTWVTQLPPLSS